MYITYGKVFGGTPTILMFSLFPENGSISKRTVNRALIVAYNSIKFSLKKKKKKKKIIIIILIFGHVPKLSIAL